MKKSDMRMYYFIIGGIELFNFQINNNEIKIKIKKKKKAKGL